MAFSENTHWRDSARAAKFFMIDAVAAFPLVLFFLHIRFWTFIVAIVTMIFFTVLRRFGFSIPVFLRLFRGFLAGPRKFSIQWWKE
ncbi:MAG: IcmT/TraK family protein [Gammaproteobacteria bacterium]